MVAGCRLAVLLGLLVSLCAAPRAEAAPREIVVAAASDVKPALGEIVGLFTQENKTAAVRVTYGSSGNFFAQISNGAPFDVFLSADVEYVRQLVRAGLGNRDTQFHYADGRLALWAPNDSMLDVTHGLALLGQARVKRVAIANPRHAPYGRAAEAALRHAGVYDAVRPKLVLGENVAQAAQFAQTGAADAGIVALSLALAPPLAAEGRHHVVPPETYPRIEQAGVIMRATRDVDTALAFRAFVLGPTGRAILARHGFVLPD